MVQATDPIVLHESEFIRRRARVEADLLFYRMQIDRKMQMMQPITYADVAPLEAALRAHEEFMAEFED